MASSKTRNVGFTADVYAGFQGYTGALPAEARHGIERLIADDRLGSYRTVEGIESALQRLSARLTLRLQRPIALEQAIGELTGNDAGLEEDFSEFFPQLQEHVRHWRGA